MGEPVPLASSIEPGLGSAFDALLTRTLATSLKAKVTYKTYDGVDHAGAVIDAKPAANATDFVKAKLG
jgi:hypothetical protein